MIKKIIPILLIIALFLSCSGCLDFSTMGVSQPMPVEVEHTKSSSSQQGGYYWRVTSALDGSGEQYVLNMPTSELNDGDIKAQKGLKLYFIPNQPYWYADAYDENTLTYLQWGDYYGRPGTLTEEVPYWKINSVNQKIIVGYTAILEDEDGRQIAEGEVQNYQVDPSDESGLMTIAAKDSDGFTRFIYIQYDGLMPEGILPPNGDFAILYDGGTAVYDSSYDLVGYGTLSNTLNKWNSAAPYTSITDADKWDDCYEYLYQNGLRSQLAATKVTGYDFTGVGWREGSAPTGMKIWYDVGTFKPVITAYIPEQLAETITEYKSAPEPHIGPISDIETVEDGSIRFEVEVSNYGSAGDIEVSAVSQVNGIQNIRASEKAQVYVDADKKYTWIMVGDVASELTDSEREILVEVTADGTVGGQWGTQDTKEFYVTVKDKDTTETAKVTVKTVFEESGEVYEDAKIYQGDAQDKFKGTGEITLDLVQGVDYTFYSEDSGEYLTQYNESNPKTITPYNDMTVTIEFGTKEEGRPNSDDDDFLTTLLIIVIGLLSLLLFYSSGVWKYLAANQMFVALIILVIVIIWAVIAITGAVNNMTDSINTGVDSVTSWREWF